MSGEKPKAEAPAPVSGSPEPLACPGVGSLLRGARREQPSVEQNIFSEPSIAPQANEQPTVKPLIPRWYFFAADVLLVAFALLIVYKSSGALDAWQTLFCVVAVIFAGILGIIGVGLGRPKK